MIFELFVSSLLFAFALFGLHVRNKIRKEKIALTQAKADDEKNRRQSYVEKCLMEGRKLIAIKGHDEHELYLDIENFTVAIDGTEWPCSAIRGVEVLSNGNRVLSTTDTGSAIGAAAIGLLVLGPVGALGGAALGLSKHDQGTRIGVRLLIDSVEQPWIDFDFVVIEGYNAPESKRAPLVEHAKMQAEKIVILLRRFHESAARANAS